MIDGVCYVGKCGPKRGAGKRQQEGQQRDMPAKKQRRRGRPKRKRDNADNSDDDDWCGGEDNL